MSKWPMVRLGQLGTIVSGTTPKTNRPEYWDGKTPWITPAELNDSMKYVFDTERKITEQGLRSSSLKLMPVNTVLLSSRAPIGKVAITAVEMCCNQGFKNIICGDKLFPDYLYWFLKGKKSYLNSLGRGATFTEISKSIVENILIPLPPLEEQKRIATMLDKAQSLIDLRKKQIAEMDALVKAKFIEMFGDIRNSRIYPYVPIKSIATVISGGTPSRDISDYWNGDIRWVKTTELQNCIIEDTEEKITHAGLDNSSAKICPPSTILIAMYGQGKTRGMTALLQTECATNQACACILPSDSHNSIYLWHYLMLCYEDLRSKAKGGNQPNLNVEIIKNYTVLLPPIKMQNDFAAFVEQVDKSKLAKQKALEQMETLYKALMQQVFS